MLDLFSTLDLHTGCLLFIALVFILFYEAINGFHDTANAVATVIYTRALRSHLAVVISGIFNFFGVLLGGLSVAYAIVHLLPADLLLNIRSTHGLIMLCSMLIAAIIWNLGTWFFGIPASSSHTLIGGIIGISLTNAWMTKNSLVDALNIPKMLNILLSLVISPLLGFIIAGGFIFILRKYWSGNKKRKRIHMTPSEREQFDGKKKPPFWTRVALILSAIGVSYSHGANDGQKGIGLIMLVLIGVAPAGFAVNMNASRYDIFRTRSAVNHLHQYYAQHPSALPLKIPSSSPSGSRIIHSEYGSSNRTKFYCDVSDTLVSIIKAQKILNNIVSYNDLKIEQKIYLRRLLMCIAETIDTVSLLPNTIPADQILLSKLKKDLLNTIEYAPTWIILMVAVALSLGTMTGWRRVATTIGEKVGKKEMTYAQGMSAQLTAAVSIGVASYTGMPVSTTHILSSSVAGTMLISGRGIQIRTMKTILIAWLLTLPISILLSGTLYALAINII
ncbi:Low-affinity inorganic phosphate transporter 1 [Candidatus Erwinia haradaeae]|uniref:Phosphate transporter n=1 Tax=Candidatus Erwinia haradaeae TaxID=1922217 RepID=A0A451DDP4_9GAMM|nr:inorganic phosphate transporter PitA [Candidatus Erwinia haradaeae]VFP84549.1 Low-affinity inorganic phosphate transporter 1 [Candidatus Erwinia haradaeae]